MSERPGNTLSLSEEDILVGRGEAGPSDRQQMLAANPGEPGPSVVAAGVVFTGNIVAKGCVQIDGELDGDVHCMTLVTGDEAVIRGSITAESVLIAGRAIGPVKTSRLVIQSGAHVEGDIEYRTIRIDSDAYVQGKLQYIKDQADSASAPELAAESADAAQDTANVVSLTAGKTAPPVGGQIARQTGAAQVAQSSNHSGAADISAISGLAERASAETKASA